MKKKPGLKKGQNTWTKEYVNVFPRGYHGHFKKIKLKKLKIKKLK